MGFRPARSVVPPNSAAVIEPEAQQRGAHRECVPRLAAPPGRQGRRRAVSVAYHLSAFCSASRALHGAPGLPGVVVARGGPPSNRGSELNPGGAAQRMHAVHSVGERDHLVRRDARPVDLRRRAHRRVAPEDQQLVGPSRERSRRRRRRARLDREARQSSRGAVELVVRMNGMCVTSRPASSIRY